MAKWHDALIVGRPAHVNRIRAQGLQLVTDAQTYTLPVPAVSRIRARGPLASSSSSRRLIASPPPNPVSDPSEPMTR